jgi:AcrR family transcriptional regulator
MSRPSIREYGVPPKTSPRRRTKTVTLKAEQRRRQILDEAAELFGAVGYANASVEDIAEACGIGKATLYHYFKSREEILFAMHEAIAEEMLAHADKFRSSNLTVREALHGSVLLMLNIIRERPGYVRVFFEHYRELSKPLQRRIVKKRDAYAAFIEELIERGVETGECRPVDPRLTMLALFGMTNWTYQWYRSSGSRSPEEVADFFVETLFEGIGA